MDEAQFALVSELLWATMIWRQLASRVEGNLTAFAVDEGKGLPVSRHPQRLALLCALDGLLSAELQTCIFRKGRDFCVYV